MVETAAGALLEAAAVADALPADAAALDELVAAWRFSSTGMAGICSAVFVGRAGISGGAPASTRPPPRGYPFASVRIVR